MYHYHRCLMTCSCNILILRGPLACAYILAFRCCSNAGEAVHSWPPSSVVRDKMSTQQSHSAITSTETNAPSLPQLSSAVASESLGEGLESHALAEMAQRVQER
jgi:hypothetical protein